MTEKEETLAQCLMKQGFYIDRENLTIKAIFNAVKDWIEQKQERLIAEPEGYKKFVQGEQYVFQELFKDLM